MNMKNSIVVFFLSVLLFNRVDAQTFYDINTIQEINIHFSLVQLGLPDGYCQGRKRRLYPCRLGSRSMAFYTTVLGWNTKGTVLMILLMPRIQCTSHWMNSVTRVLKDILISSWVTDMLILPWSGRHLHILFFRITWIAPNPIMQCVYKWEPHWSVLKWWKHQQEVLFRSFFILLRILSWNAILKLLLLHLRVTWNI